MGKRKFFDIRNLSLSLKAIGTSIVTSLIWIVPFWVSRYAITQLNMLLVSVLIGLVSLAGYLYTWGFIANRLWDMK